MEEAHPLILLINIVWAISLIGAGIYLRVSKNTNIKSFRDTTLPLYISTTLSHIKRLSQPFFGIKP
jgi:hypothetical protein